MSRVIPISQLKNYRSENITQCREEVVASGLLVIGNRVLLVKRSVHNHPDPGAWGLPCGGIESSETPEEAARREFREETGIEVKVKNFITQERYFYDEGNTRTYITEFIFHVEPLTNDIVVTLNKKELDDFCFAALNELKTFHSLVAPRKKAIRKISKAN